MNIDIYLKPYQNLKFACPSFNLDKTIPHSFSLDKQLIILVEILKIYSDRIANRADHDQTAHMCQLIWVCTACMGRISFHWQALVKTFSDVKRLNHFRSIIVITKKKEKQ
jgi:hypothetical protein